MFKFLQYSMSLFFKSLFVDINGYEILELSSIQWKKKD